jgi:hypothetical protein
MLDHLLVLVVPTQLDILLLSGILLSLWYFFLYEVKL